VDCSACLEVSRGEIKQESIIIIIIIIIIITYLIHHTAQHQYARKPSPIPEYRWD